MLDSSNMVQRGESSIVVVEVSDAGLAVGDIGRGTRAIFPRAIGKDCSTHETHSGELGEAAVQQRRC